MKPCFIELGLDKYQICICPECACDAVRQTCAALGNGRAYFISSCGTRGHAKYAEDIKQQLSEGADPHSLPIEIEELFIKPPDKEEKCKLLQWEEFEANPEEAAPLPQPKPQAQRRNEAKVCDEWAWVSRMDWWMDAEGSMVRLRSLRIDELVSSVLAIRDLNFSRVTKRIAWTKQLVVPKVKYEYPEEELSVGYQEAGLKLDEFQEEANERGLL